MKYNSSMKPTLEISSNLSTNKFFLYFLMSILSALFILFVKLGIYSYASMTIYILLGLSIFMIPLYKNIESSKFVIRAQPTLTRILLVIFFISLTLGIACLAFFNSLYTKSLLYYIFIGVCTSSLFIVSMLIDNNSSKKFLPFLVSVLGLSILLSNFLAFPNGVYTSGDTHLQIYNILLPIVENGYIPSGFTYSFFPIHQILVASLALITGIKPIFLYLSLLSILYAISALFAYSSIKRASSPTYGIAAMLLFITAPSFFYNGTHAYQFSYALPLGILLMYLTTVLTVSNNYKENQKLTQNRINWTLIRIIVIGVLVFTHQFTSTIIFILVALLILIYYIISKDNTNIKFPYHYILILYIVMLFCHWIYISSTLPSFTMAIKVYSSSLLSVENYHAASTNLSSDIHLLRPFWLAFLDMSGIGMMLMLGSIGSLYGVWKKNKYVFLWFLIGVIIWTFISIGEFIKMPLLLGNRLSAFVELISFIYLSTFGIILLIERFGTKGLMFCSILFLLIPIFSLGSTLAGSETSLFVGDQPYLKFYDTNSDIHYRTWIKNSVPEKSNIWVSEPWVHKFLDNKRIYNSLLVDSQDNVADSVLKPKNYVILNKHDCIGIRVRGISEREQIESVENGNLSTVEAKKLHERVTKINISEIKRVTSKLGCIYSNGENNICLKYS